MSQIILLGSSKQKHVLAIISGDRASNSSKYQSYLFKMGEKMGMAVVLIQAIYIKSIMAEEQTTL